MKKKRSKFCQVISEHQEWQLKQVPKKDLESLEGATVSEKTEPWTVIFFW